MPSIQFGKNPAKHDYRTLRIKNYLSGAIAPPPTSYDVLPAVYQELGVTDPKILFPMDGNDSLQDCTIAAVAHATTIFQGLSGVNNIMSVQNVIKLYYQFTKGLNVGLNELDVLNYWKDNSVSGEQILAFVSIDPKNHIHVEQSIKLFGGVYLGFHVQQACENDFKNGRNWTPGPLINEGHAVFATGYDLNQVTVLTWGQTQNGTWDWWDECVDEVYAVVPASARSWTFPIGFDFEQLLSDLAEVSN